MNEVCGLVLCGLLGSEINSEYDGLQEVLGVRALVSFGRLGDGLTHTAKGVSYADCCGI
jgi:hypothetical protein